jgi:hypothetical protein
MEVLFCSGYLQLLEDLDELTLNRHLAFLLSIYEGYSSIKHPRLRYSISNPHTPISSSNQSFICVVLSVKLYFDSINIEYYELSLKLSHSC